MLCRQDVNGLTTCGRRYRFRHRTSLIAAFSRASSAYILCLPFIHPARTELDRSPVCRHHACMISSFVRALISGRRVQKKRNQLQTGAPGRFGLEVSRLCVGAQLAISVHNCPVLADTRFPMSIFQTHSAEVCEEGLSREELA